MADIKERLDNLRIHIQEPEFLEGKGLSNEVNIRIFCYDAADEMTVRQFIDQIVTDQSMGCNLVECNLYEIFLSLCDDIDITDAIAEMEEADGKEFLLEQLHSAIGEGEFIDKIQYNPHKKGDVLLLMYSPLCVYIRYWKHCNLTSATFPFLLCTPEPLTVAMSACLTS